MAKKSYIELIRKVSVSGFPAIGLTKKEYDLLVKEIWDKNGSMKMRYPDISEMPMIKEYLGVKLTVW